MFKHRHAFLLMSAAALALSAGGAAITTSAPEAPEFPDDGKVRIKHAHTEQVHEFDTQDQADGFIKAVTDAADWRPMRNGVPAYMNYPAVELAPLDFTPADAPAADAPATDAAAADQASAPAGDQ